MTGIPAACTICALDLDATNITGVCLECRHIARAAAAGFIAAEVPIEEARANFMAVLAGHYRPMDGNAVYTRAACRRCGRFRARHDTGCCEWCSGPRRFPAKRTRRTKPVTTTRGTKQ